MTTTPTTPKEALAAWDRAVAAWRTWIVAEETLGLPETTRKLLWRQYNSVARHVPTGATPSLTAYGY